MKVTVIDEQNTDIRWEFRQEPKSGRMAVKWLKDGTQDQIVTILKQALEEAKNQYSMVGLPASNLVTIDGQLFNDLIYLAINNTEFVNKLCNIKVNSEADNNVTMDFKPSGFLFRLSEAIKEYSPQCNRPAPIGVDSKLNSLNTWKPTIQHILHPEKYPDAWVIQLGKNEVQFNRVIDGRIEESYAPVNYVKANVYAAAILNGLQPPRDLRLSDKPTD
ncbi:hypothetical protein AB6F89_02905 [Providencia hangzhouensis]|uniref:hypothetical protein n=1 Tax=Providencia TaxID=586 RepID=UPI0034DD4267